MTRPRRVRSESDFAHLARIMKAHRKTYARSQSNLALPTFLEGSVQKSADTVRVNVQLIKAASDSHLWSDTFDRKLTDILSVETEVAKTIADQLRAKLTGDEQQVIAARPTEQIFRLMITICAAWLTR